MADLIGQTLSGRYEILELLGEGGTARVYLAQQLPLRRKVAVKVMLPQLAQTPDFKIRFEREARLIAQLHHPNIIQVFDFNSIPEELLYYTVINLINGPSLVKRIEEARRSGTPLPLPETIRIIRDIASALEYAHSRNMVHGDIKPGNVMLDHGHHVVLTDFGLSHLINLPGEGFSLVTGGGTLGTPAYVAPEQSMGTVNDPRSDLYSLGVMLYQMVTNRLPFWGDTPVAVILKHMQEIPTSPRTQIPHLPPDVEYVILRLMAKAPDDRYQTASEVIAALDNLDPMPTMPLTPLALKTTVNPLPEIDDRTPMLTSEPTRRRPSILTLGVLALVALAAMMLVASNYLFTPTSPIIAVADSATATPTASATSSPTATPTVTATFTLTPTITNTPQTCRATVVAQVIDLRAGPGKNYQLVGIRLRAGTLITVTGTAQAKEDQAVWWLVQVNVAQSGWLPDSAIKRDEDCGDVPTIEVGMETSQTPTLTTTALSTKATSASASTRRPSTRAPGTSRPPTNRPPTNPPPTTILDPVATLVPTVLQLPIPTLPIPTIPLLGH